MSKNLINHLNKKDSTSHIYGIFDGVKYPMLWSDLEDGVLEYDMLFREDELRAELEEVAPYLVKLDFNSELSVEQSSALMKCYGQSGCVFLTTSQLHFEELLEAIREIFYIYTKEGEKGYMRFYDPSIFIKYIEQDDPNILYALFNGIEHYWCEDVEDTNMLLHYSLDHGKVIKKSIAIKEEKGA